MQPKRPTSMSTAMLVALGVSLPLILAESQFASVLAQSSSTVKIDNLTRMAPINQALKKQYEAQFPDTSIQIKTQQTQSNLKSLQNQQADLAAISRLLTAKEQAQGLVQVPVVREKIAIVVGKDNAFAKGLTIDQVVKIFRGEITNWSQVGGKPGSIRVIHRPIASNLQSTLQTYDLFRQSTFEAGGNTIQLDQDSVTALTAELGSDGISYALASQIIDAKGIRPVSMYNTLPDDPKYPFSQPFTYVYQGEPSPSTKVFLDYVASKQGQQAIDNATTTPLSGDLNASSASSSPQSSTDAQPASTNSPSGSATNPNVAPSDPNSSTVPSSSTTAEEKTQDNSDGLGWLPIGLIILVLGGIAGCVLKALQTKRQPKAPPRPAPNYAERIRPTTLQNPSTKLQAPSENLASTAPISETEESKALFPENIAGAAAGATAAGIAETLSNPPSAKSVSKSQSTERVDITSKELQAQTRLQTPKTELQDTPLTARDPKTKRQDSTATQLQAFDDIEIYDSSPTQFQDPSPTQLQDPSPTQLQDPKQTWTHDEEFPEGIDSSPTQLQDPSATQLQDPNPTQLQDPKQTWTQDAEFPEGINSSPTQLQDPNPTQLQDPKQTWTQDEELPEGLDPSPTQLQDPNRTQLQDPKQTWIQDD